MNHSLRSSHVGRRAARKRAASFFAGACIVCATGFGVLPSSAQEKVSFAGKTIIVNSPTTPSGGYDIYARAFARHVAKHLPGSPSVVVRNRPGAGGVVLANHIYNVAPKDGTEVAALLSGTVFTSLLTGSPVQFEPSRFGWLGSLEKFVPIVIAWHTTPVFTFDDLKTKHLSVGGTGVGSNSVGYPYSLNAFLGTNFKVINGYPGVPELTLAMERGELDGFASWCWDCLKQQKPTWLSKKLVRVILQLSFEGDPELTAMGVPTMADVAKTEEQKSILGVVLSGAEFGRPFVAPPGLPPAVLKVWQKAFEETAHDPELIAEMKAAGGVIRFSPPDVIQKLLALASTLDGPTLARLRAAYSGGGKAQ